MADKSEQSQIELRTDESKKSRVLHMRGDLAIRQSKTVAKALLEALDGSMPLRLNLQKLCSIDLIIIQSLFAAHQQARKKNIAFEIDGECPQVFIDAVHNAGLNFHTWLCFE